jgi:hypothetical protein
LLHALKSDRYCCKLDIYILYLSYWYCLLLFHHYVLLLKNKVTIQSNVLVQAIQRQGRHQHSKIFMLRRRNVSIHKMSTAFHPFGLEYSRH